MSFSSHDIKTGIKRLSRLSSYLSEISPPNFDLNSWATHKDVYEGGETKSEKKILREIKEGACGTTACACGHAAMIPEFRKAGFRLVVDEVDNIEEEADAEIVFHPRGSVLQYEGIDAAKMFFKISLDDAEHLFMPFEYPGEPTKEQVIKRINAQIKKMEKSISKRG